MNNSGDAVELTDGMELTWMRQPHYYMGLYSYTYSAGLTIGTVVSQKLKRRTKSSRCMVRNVKSWRK